MAERVGDGGEREDGRSPEGTFGAMREAGFQGCFDGRRVASRRGYTETHIATRKRAAVSGTASVLLRLVDDQLFDDFAFDDFAFDNLSLDDFRIRGFQCLLNFVSIDRVDDGSCHDALPRREVDVHSNIVRGFAQRSVEDFRRGFETNRCVCLTIRRDLSQDADRFQLFFFKRSYALANFRLTISSWI